MIKLVVSDIDGTLLPDGTDKINPDIYGVIERLKEKGILFAAASGRQYASMLHVFRPVADDIIFIAENGTNVMCRGKNMSADYIERDLAEELVRYIRSIEECEIVLSTPEVIYLETDSQELYDLLKYSYHVEVEVVEDVLPFCERTNKITIYRKHGIEALAAESQKQFGERLNVAVAGKLWIDFISRTADKGTALGVIQDIMHIAVDETMAFGDNCNDIGMLGRATESYAVANAHPRLKAVARHEAPSYTEDGVINTIRRELLGE